MWCTLSQADNFKNLRELDVATTDDTCSETITDDCSLAKCDVMFGKNYAYSSDVEACKTTKDGRRKKRTKRRPIRRRAICRKPVSNDYDSELHPRRPGGGIRRQFGCSDCDEFFCQNSPQRLNHIDSKHRSIFETLRKIGKHHNFSAGLIIGNIWKYLLSY